MPHTPGPWEISLREMLDGWVIVVDRDGGIVANVNTETGPNIPPLVSRKMPAGANAALIAAAPEMLSMLLELQECAGYWSEYDVPLGLKERLDEVIKKARGGNA